MEGIKVTTYRLILLVAFFALGNADTVYALAKAPESAHTDIIMSDNKGSELQLEVRQMPLAQVLKTVEKQTRVPIHYSVLPEGYVTATCVASSLKPLLECLLNRKADIIVRYAKNNGKASADQTIAEAWVLGAKLDATPDGAVCNASSEQGSIRLQNKVASDDIEPHREPDQIDELLKLADYENATTRAEAIGQLLALGRKNDPRIMTALQSALADKDAAVRAQAVSSLTHLSDNKATTAAAFQQALQDSSVDVRLMAVDGISDDVGLLQQATSDSDEVVRSLAQEKLNALTANTGSGQKP